MVHRLQSRDHEVSFATLNMNLTLVVPNSVPAQYLNYSTEAITVWYPMLKFTRIFKYEVKIGVSYKTFGTIST